MKQPKRILAYSALALIVMLAAFGAIAFDTSNVALAQDTAPVPVAPTLTAQASGETTINLSWNDVDDAESFELWSWDNVNEWQRLDGGTANPLTAITFPHTGLTSGRTYYYQVRAITEDGRTGAWSERVNEVAGDAPARPVLTATPGYMQITVSWPPVTGAATYELWAWDGAWTRLDDGTLTAMSYVHTGLTAGRTVYYQARAVNAGGTMSAWSAQVSTTVLSAPTLSAPQSLAAASGDEEITLTWTAPGTGAATGYHYRYGETGGTMGSWTGLGNVLTVTVSSLTNGQGYDFEVRGFNSQGNGPAAMASATPMGVPDMPGNLSASPTETTVVLTWTAPDNNGAAITHYEHQHYASSGTAPTTWTNAGDVTTVTISSLTKGTAYTFNVRAVNSVGEGPVATVDETPSGKPGSVRNLTATGGAGSIKLDWDEPSDNGGSAIVRYEVQKYNATSTNWGLAYSGADTSYTDRSATIGATTEYRVRAYNANANDPSDWATISGIAQARAVPGAPKNLMANRGDGSISYTWEAPDDIGGTPITRYEYRNYQTGTDDDDIPDWTSASLRTGASFPNLDSAQTYDFDVRAVNAVGAGAAESLDATPAATKPSLPRRFTAVADNSDAEIELDWDNPLEDGGADLVGYNLQVKEGADGEWADITGWAVDDTETTEGHDITTGLTFGVTYYYRIRAFNVHNDDTPTAYSDDDKVWAEASATVASSYPAQVAAAPTTSFADGRITVEWEKPADHGRPITSYKLRWMSGTDTDFPAANVVSVQAPATRYIMIGPVPAADYEFQVLAVNSLTDDDDIDDSALGNDTTKPIKWSLTSAVLTVPAVSVQPDSSTDSANGLAATIASDGRATITWRMLADEDANEVTQYTVASYDLEYVVVGVPEGETTLPTTLADTDDAWDDAISENIAAQALMQRITEPLAGNRSLFVRVRVVSTVGTKSVWMQTEPDATNVPARAPDHPEPTATIIGQNILLSWDEPESNGEPILRYELQFKKDTGDFGDGTDVGTNTDDTADDDDVITIARMADPVNTGEFIPAATSYSHENLDASATYTYRIRTVTVCNDETAANCGTDTAVEGADRKWSAEVMATSDPGPDPDPVAPGIPTTLMATADDADGQIELSWGKPSEGSEPISSYQIQRWNGSAWEMLPTSLGAAATSYNDTTANLGQMYYYAIRAVSAAGTGDWTQHSFPSAMLAAKAPDMPELLATVDGQSIVLSWMAPAANGADITGYEIQVTHLGPVNADGIARDEAARTWDNAIPDGNSINANVGDTAFVPVPALSTTFTHSSLTPGRTLYYRIRAVNSVNADATGTALVWSDEVSATVAPMAPDAPTWSTSPEGAPDGGNTVVVLTWVLPGPDTDATNADVVDTGGAPITSVEIQRWNSAASMWDDIRTHPVSLTDADTPDYMPASETYTDTGLEDGKMYTYRLRAVNVAGESPWSSLESSTTAIAAPDMPVLTATVMGQDITLNWNTPDDNGAEITAYHIQRFPSIADDGTVNNDWGDDVGANGRDGTSGNADDDPDAESDVIIPMPAGVTTYTDRDLQPGTTYYYRIRAVNSVNMGQTEGARTWSAEVPATTDPKAPDRMVLTLASGDQMITLTWTAPAHNGSPISEYQIQRWNSVNRVWVTIKDQLPSSVTSFEDKGLDAGTRYFYRIRAVNAGGEGMWSTLKSEVTADAE